AFAFPLREYLSFLITDPNYNAPFLTPTGEPNPNFNPGLAPFDATRIDPNTGLPGVPFFFSGKRTGKEYSFYIQDAYRYKNFTINAGVRVTNYRQFVRETGAQPRVAISYYIPQTGTVLRASYDRLFIPPENEGLLISSAPEVAAVSGANSILIRPE